MGESHCTTRSPGSVRWQCGDLVGQRASKVLTHGIVHFYHQNGLIDLRMMEGYGIAGSPDPDRKRGLLHAGLSWAPRSAARSAGAAGSPESRPARRPFYHGAVRRPSSASRSPALSAFTLVPLLGQSKPHPPCRSNTPSISNDRPNRFQSRDADDRCPTSVLSSARLYSAYPRPSLSDTSS